MKFKVTQKNINQGKHHASSCPIALALKSKFKLDYVSVDEDDLEMRSNCFELKMKTPKRLRTFVERFDDDKFVKPFEFDLQLK